MATEQQTGSYIKYGSHPPYESPLDMQYPMHFDNSADHVQRFDEHELVCKISNQLAEAVEELRARLGLGFAISVTQAITGAARAQNPLNPALTPIFLAVGVFEGDANKIKDFHDDIIAIIKRHYPPSDFSEFPGLTKPVVRYFIEEGDHQFSAESGVEDIPKALEETSDSLPALDTQYPAHFDTSAELIDFLEDDHPVYEASHRLRKEVQLFREKTGTSFSASVSEAITIFARAQNPKEPARTPFFIEVRINIRDVNNIREFHDDIVEIVKRHFPKSEFPDHPDLTTPVLRYFLWDTCWPG